MMSGWEEWALEDWNEQQNELALKEVEDYDKTRESGK